MGYSIYCHVFPNGKKYIGITGKDPLIRWGRDGKGYEGQVVYNAIKKYGWDNICHIILAEGLCKELAEDMECELIKEYNSNNIEYGYNISNGGNSNADCRGTKIYCYELGIIFNSYTEAQNLTGASSVGIYDSIRKRHSSSGIHPITGDKLHWCYAENIDNTYNTVLLPIHCTELDETYDSILDVQNKFNIDIKTLSDYILGREIYPPINKKLHFVYA